MSSRVIGQTEFLERVAEHQRWLGRRDAYRTRAVDGPDRGEMIALPRDGRLALGDVMVADIEVSGENLDGLIISRSLLRNVTLIECELGPAGFWESRFEGSRLVRCTSRKANFIDADCQGVDFSGTSLYRAELHRTDFRGADLTDASFGGCLLLDVDMRGAILERSHFDWVVSSRTKLHGMHRFHLGPWERRKSAGEQEFDLSPDATGPYVRLEDAFAALSVTGERLGSHRYGPRTDLVDMGAATFLNAAADHAGWLETAPAKLLKTKPPARARGGKPAMSSIRVAGLKASGLRLTGAVFASCRFENCEFEACDFVGAELYHSEFPGCTFRRCNFAHAELNNVGADGVDFAGCDFSEADLRLASLRAANVAGCNFSAALLHEADLRDANLEDAAFQGTAMYHTRMYNSRRFHMASWNLLSVYPDEKLDVSPDGSGPYVSAEEGFSLLSASDSPSA